LIAFFFFFFLPFSCFLPIVLRPSNAGTTKRHGLSRPERCARVSSAKIRSLLGGWDKQGGRRAISASRRGGFAKALPLLCFWVADCGGGGSFAVRKQRPGLVRGPPQLFGTVDLRHGSIGLATSVGACDTFVAGAIACRFLNFPPPDANCAALTDSCALFPRPLNHSHP
jgi:hypothetical protein